MAAPSGKRIHSAGAITDQEIMAASLKWHVTNEGAPGLKELLELRDCLEIVTGRNLDMLCPVWLHNQRIRLAKDLAGRNFKEILDGHQDRTTRSHR